MLGGTGTLRPAVLSLCRGGAAVLVAGRGRGRLDALARQCAPGAVRGIVADYHLVPEFAAALRAAAGGAAGSAAGGPAAHGGLDAALLYCPGIPAASMQILTQVVGGPVVLLLTSQWAEPGRRPRLPLPGIRRARLRYLLLGWRQDARDAGTRWHTPAEISAAALAALRDGEDHVLGRLRPWDERPA